MNCIFPHPSYAFVFTWYEQCLHLYQRYSIFHSAVHELFNLQRNEILRGWSKLLETVMKITSTEARSSLAIRYETYGLRVSVTHVTSTVNSGLCIVIGRRLALHRKKDERVWLEATCCATHFVITWRQR
jgi:hypothetical protein